MTSISMFGESFPPDTFTHEHRRYKAVRRLFPDYPTANQYAERAILDAVKPVDVLVYERHSKNPHIPPDYRIYLTPKHYDTISLAKAREIGYDLNPFDRKTHIQCMYTLGQRGITDMAKFSGKFVVQPVAGLSGVAGVSSADISPDHDIIGFDHPRDDIRVEKTQGKTMRTGGNTFAERAILANAARRVLHNNFTQGEVRKMNLFFEANPVSMHGAAGTHSSYKSYGRPPISTISVSPTDLTEAVLTHEIVHALRAADGRRAVHDQDSEEIETEYESTLRLHEPRKARGYYQYMPGVCDKHGKYDISQIEDAILTDRILATGTTDKPLKGRRLTHNIVPNTVERSHIETARHNFPVAADTTHRDSQLMTAEDVDNYFQIKLPDKSTIEYHIRFNEARPSLAKIKKHLKEKFGKNIEAWEWQDGKRVRLISRSKKRTTTKKRTTKKATTRKTPSKRRVPAAKTPNQYLKGIPPIPGGFL